MNYEILWATGKKRVYYAENNNQDIISSNNNCKWLHYLAHEKSQKSIAKNY